jgi:hypothetical protein
VQSARDTKRHLPCNATTKWTRSTRTRGLRSRSACSIGSSSSGGSGSGSGGSIVVVAVGIKQQHRRNDSVIIPDGIE